MNHGIHGKHKPAIMSLMKQLARTVELDPYVPLLISDPEVLGSRYVTCAAYTRLYPEVVLKQEVQKIGGRTVFNKNITLVPIHSSFKGMVQKIFRFEPAKRSANRKGGWVYLGCAAVELQEPDLSPVKRVVLRLLNWLT